MLLECTNYVAARTVSTLINNTAVLSRRGLPGGGCAGLLLLGLQEQGCGEHWPVGPQPPAAQGLALFQERPRGGDGALAPWWAGH